MDFLFHVQVNDRGVLGIEVDLFHASDWHACDENLAAGLESADVCESGVYFVGGTTDGRARASLDCEPDNGGDAQENKRADRQFDVGLLHAKNELFVEAGPEGDDIVAKASHNAIVGGGELGRRSLEMDPALFEQGDAIAGGERFRDIVGHDHGGKIEFLAGNGRSFRKRRSAPAGRDRPSVRRKAPVRDA